jgi:membrane protease YdiL (CAAX protease family)
MVFLTTTALPNAFTAAASLSAGRRHAPIVLATLAAAGLAGLGAGPAWAVPLLVSPVVEEVVFRLGLQQTLIDRTPLAPDISHRPHRLQRLRPTVATAAAFAAAHFILRPSLTSALTFLPALAIGAVYERQRRVLPCVALHALFNTVWCLGTARLA